MVLLWILSLAGPAQAQAPNVVTSESTLTGTVDRIERFSRVVTFRSNDNVLQSVYVDPKVTAFDDLKVGDVVTVRYIASVIVQVRPDAKPTEVRDTTEEARKAGNENVMQQLKAVVTVEDVDSQGLFVTYRTHDNRRVVRAVTDKRLLDGVRPGDRVEVTLTRDRAISIERGRL
jgi:ABC-type cobalamin transport system ATPase subunit